MPPRLAGTAPRESCDNYWKNNYLILDLIFYQFSPTHPEPPKIPRSGRLLLPNGFPFAAIGVLRVAPPSTTLTSAMWARGFFLAGSGPRGQLRPSQTLHSRSPCFEGRPLSLAGHASSGNRGPLSLRGLYANTKKNHKKSNIPLCGLNSSLAAQ